jgi:membrane protein implicated in regulation of membrane protease activity
LVFAFAFAMMVVITIVAVIAVVAFVLAVIAFVAVCAFAVALDVPVLFPIVVLALARLPVSIGARWRRRRTAASRAGSNVGASHRYVCLRQRPTDQTRVCAREGDGRAREHISGEGRIVE